MKNNKALKVSLKNEIISRTFFVAVCMAAGISAMQAQILDNDGEWLSATGAGGWSDSTKWVGGTIAYGEDQTATFTNMPGRTITLTEDIVIGNIVVASETYSSGSWTISGTHTLTLATSGADAPLIDLDVQNGNNILSITAVLAGTDGFKKVGRGRLYLSNPGNIFTGGVEIAEFELYSASEGTMNGNTVTLSGGTWLMHGAATTSTYQNDVILAADVGALRVNNPYIVLDGSISETGGKRDLNITSNNVNGHITLMKGSTYTGNTNIGNSAGDTPVVVRAAHNNAFGLGVANVRFSDNGTTKAHDDDALELTNNITISDKTLTLRGTGKNNAGSLRSISGDNTWEGNVDTGTFGNATLGVDADELTIEGVISGTGENGLTKVGEGVLVLNNNNTYSGGTTVNAGVLQVGHDNALAGGALVLGDGEGVDSLRLASGVSLNVSNLTLTSSASFDFTLNGVFDATRVLVAGGQIGDGTYTVNIFDNGIVEGTYTLLQITGSYAATNFILGTPNANYSLDWEEGTLSLNVIPEPDSALLLALALSAGIFFRNRKIAVS